MKHHVSSRRYFIVCLLEEKVVTFWALTSRGGVKKKIVAIGHKRRERGQKIPIFAVISFLNMPQGKNKYARSEAFHEMCVQRGKGVYVVRM